MTCLSVNPYLGGAGGAGTMVAFVDSVDDDVKIYDWASWTLRATASVGGNPRGLAFHPFLPRLYVCNNTGDSVSVINLTTFAVTTVAAVGDGPRSIVISPDGVYYFLAFNGDDVIRKYRVSDNGLDDTSDAFPVLVGHEFGLTITPDGLKLYVCGSGEIEVLSAVTLDHITTITAGLAGSLLEAACSPVGDKVYVGRAASSSLYPIDTATDTAGAAISLAGIPTGIAFDPLGVKCYVSITNSEEALQIVDVATNTAGSRTATVSNNQALSVSLNRAGTRAFVPSGPSNVTVYALPGLTVLADESKPGGGGGYSASRPRL
jgi:YVTN family beta-propeller protein